MNKRATKPQVNKILADAGMDKYKIHARGESSDVVYTARNRNVMGFCDRSKTVVNPNGLFTVAVWGRNLDVRMQTMVETLRSAGFTVENVTNNSFETHNGIVLAQ